MSDSDKTEVVEVPVEAIEAMAESINQISDGVTKMFSSGLTERAILVLIKDSCGQNVNMLQIKKVIRAIETLGVKYLTKDTP